MDVQGAWRRLSEVRELTFEARSRSALNTGWNGSGKGTVQVERIDFLTLLFHEKGLWVPSGGHEMGFRNVFRWTVDAEGRCLRLEHPRFGMEQPVYLFDLMPASERTLESSEPHVCREDRYAARMELEQQVIYLLWTVSGPTKDESILYCYK
jgi:hypothetical protein